MTSARMGSDPVSYGSLGILAAILIVAWLCFDPLFRMGFFAYFAPLKGFVKRCFNPDRNRDNGSPEHKLVVR